MASASDEAARLKAEGNELIQQKRYEEAETKYSEAIQLQPKNSVLYLNRSQALFSSGKFDRAWQDAAFLIDNRSIASELQLSTKAFFRIGNSLHSLSKKYKGKQGAIYHHHPAVIQWYLTQAIKSDKNPTASKLLHDHRVQILSQQPISQVIPLQSSRLSSKNNEKLLGSNDVFSVKENDLKESNSLFFENPLSQKPKSESSSVQILFGGVGKYLQNMLQSAKDISKSENFIGQKLNFFLNDISLPALARSLVLVVLASRAELFSLFLSVFYDSFLSQSDWSKLQTVFSEIIEGFERGIEQSVEQAASNGAAPGFVTVLPGFSVHIKDASLFLHIFLRWKGFSCAVSFLQEIRLKALEEAGIHARKKWREQGGIFVKDAQQVNPIMWDIATLQPLDQKGPFTPQFESWTAEQSAEYIQTQWKRTLQEPLLDFSRLNFLFVLGDFVSLAEDTARVSPQLRFDWIETNYLVDKLGIWNLLLPCASLLSSGECYVKTKSKLGKFNRYQQLLTVYAANDDDCEALLKCFRLSAKSINKEEKQIATTHWTVKGKAEENEQTVVGTITRLLMRITLIPPIPNISLDEAYENGYVLPHHTTLSYLRIIQYLHRQKEGSAQYLVDLTLLNELSERPFIKHRSLSIRILASLMGPLLGNAFLETEKEFRIPRGQISWRSIKLEPTVNLVKGTYSLALLLLDSEELVQSAIESQQTGHERSGLFAMMISQDQDALQIVDNVQFCPFSNTLSYLDCPDMKNFHYAFVIDILTYKLVAKPVLINK